MRHLPTIFELPEVFEGLFKGSLQPVIQGQELLKVDVKESPERYVVHADVPGVAKENIQVNFDKGTLSIEVAERKNNEVKEGEKVVRSERYFSSKYRAFHLGDSIDESAIEASYKDGVLELVLPKKESAKVTKQIESK